METFGCDTDKILSGQDIVQSVRVAQRGEANGVHTQDAERFGNY